MLNNHLEINKNSWNRRTEIHIQSDFYDIPSFINGKTSLNTIELDLLGDIKGKRILHLQCHFGQDTLSLARMGAQVVGVDLSNKAIEKAKELAQKLQIDSEFICSDVLDLEGKIEGEFDYIFTSYGVLGWLPDLHQWAKVVHAFLKPNGKLLLIEFHPVVWMFDDSFKTVSFSYFNKGAMQDSSETYTDGGGGEKLEFVYWNHALEAVFKGLLDEGMEIKHFSEYDYSPYPCFDNIVETAPQRYQIKGLEEKIPMVYALVAQR